MIWNISWKPALVAALIIATNISQEAKANDYGIDARAEKYISIFAGANIPADIMTDTIYSTTPGTARETYFQDRGLALRAAFGRQINNRVRGEVELGYNNSNQLTIRENVAGVVTDYAGRGNLRTYTALANVWVDLLPPESLSPVVPYIGGGIGAALVDANLIYTGFPNYGPQKTSIEFAGQIGGGINWQLNELFDLGIGYRANFVSGPKTSQRTSAAGEITTYEMDDLISHIVGITLTMKIK